MKLVLERIDARGLDITAGGFALRIARAENLRGQLADQDVTASSDAVALEAFSVALGALLLQSAAGLLLEGVSASKRAAPHFALEMSSDVASTDELVLTVDDVVMRAKPRLDGMRLSIRGDEGSLRPSTWSSTTSRCRSAASR